MVGCWVDEDEFARERDRSEFARERVRVEDVEIADEVVFPIGERSRAAMVVVVPPGRSRRDQHQRREETFR